MFAVRVGLQKFNIEHNFEIESIIRLYARWIREGRLKVNSDWNKERKIKFTVQDPCQLVRKTYGDPMAEDLRFVTKALVGEENFIDMTPNRSNNYCCGGGGGFLQNGMPNSTALRLTKMTISGLPRWETLLWMSSSSNGTISRTGKQ